MMTARATAALRGLRLPLAVAVILPICAWAGPAQAGPETLLPTPSSANPHCAVVAQPVEPDEASSRLIASGCFATENEARNFGKYGTATPSAFTVAEATAAIQLGQDHTGQNRSGSSLTFWGDGPSCGPASYKFVLYSPWNNVFSSAMVQSDTACTYGHHYNYSNWTGAKKSCSNLTCAGTLGALDNKASSIWYRNTT